MGYLDIRTARHEVLKMKESIWYLNGMEDRNRAVTENILDATVKKGG